jgi:hypothetical protein
MGWLVRADRQDFGFGIACPQRVLALQGGDGLDRVGPADGLRDCLGEAEVPDLALGDQLLHRPGDVFDGDAGIDTVLAEEVDVIGSQALE